MRTSICSLFIFLVSSCWGLYAQSLNVSISKDTVLLGNQIRLTYELENIDVEIEDPYLENCRVLGPSVSSQYQNINGEVSQKKSYSYFLTPLADGQLIIEGLNITSGEHLLTSEPIYIIVVPNPDGIIEEEPSMNNGSFQNFFFGSPLEIEKKEELQKDNKGIKSKRKRRKI